MDAQSKISSHLPRVKGYALTLAVLWTAVVALSLGWNVIQVKRNTLEAARIQAWATFEKDVIYRRWNAQHGGVFAPVIGETQPNPYLDVPERDIATPLGKALTLINPAYMTRQVHELGEKKYGVRGHITSLNPIRPQNVPDPWEREALEAFERDVAEVSSVEEIDGEEYLRFMRPLMTEKGCLKCHAVQGYEVGDIRGGISVSVPMEPLWAISHVQVLTLVLGHVLLWLMGLAGVILGTRRLRRSERERNKAAEALQEAKEKAEAANRVKSEFLAHMSHELRTPLNAILGFSRIMRRDPAVTSSQQEDLTVISRSGLHLLDLINDVLEMSKIEAGRMTLNESTIDLYTLLDTLGSMFHLRVQDKGLELTFERSPAVPRHIRCDERKLRQVFMNLLSNAAKFTEKGRISVRVGYEREEEEGKPSRPEGRLLVEVEDTGPGIAQEEMEKLFEAFSQTASGRKAQEGTGLGLAISHRFVQLMGGDIEVTSEVGRGSVFKFDVLAAEAEAETVKEIRKLRRVMGLAPGQRLPRILVVDDVENNRRLLVKVLESVGLEAREATNGEEAISVWESWEPQLIWMDMAMPVMNGYEATQRIKSTIKGQATVIVALTASVLEEDRTKVFDSGCDDFVRKPFRESEIFETMAKHLGLEYLYEKEEEREVVRGRAAELTPEALSCLPPELLASLQAAASLGDLEALKSLVKKVEGYDKNLSVTMRDMIRDFRLEPIITALKGKGRDSGEESS
jgi:hypothetical protein